MLVAASGKYFRSPNPILELSLAAFTPGHHLMLAIPSRLNRAFFLGLNSICRRFRFIVQFSFPQNQRISTLFPPRPIIRRQFEMPEKCAKNLLSKSLMFFAN
jgi:hypothetical protein